MAFLASPGSVAQDRSAGKDLGSVAILLLLLTVFVWDRSVLAVSLPDIRHALRLNPHQVGVIATSFTAGIALIALPAGLLVQRIGFRGALITGVLLFSAATAYTPLAKGFWDLLVSRVLVGLGEGVFHVTLLLFLAGISGRHRAALIGLAATVYGLGAITGPSVITLFNADVGTWRWSFYLLGLGGVLLCAPLFLVSPPPVSAPSVVSEDAAGRSLGGRLARYWPLLVLAGVQGLALYSITGLLPVWTRTNFGFTAAAAALTLGAAGFGMMLGGAPMGLIADRLERVPYLLAGACVSAVTAILLMAFNLGPAAATGLAWLFGLATQTSYVTAIAMAQDGAGDDAPALVGLIVTVFYGAAAASGWMLLSAAETFGYRGGALGTYALLYGCGILIFATSQQRELRSA